MGEGVWPCPLLTPPTMLLPILLLAASAAAQPPQPPQSAQPCNEVQENTIKNCKTKIYSETNYNPVAIITGDYNTACNKMGEFAQCPMLNCISMKTNQLLGVVSSFCQNPGLKEMFSTTGECLAGAALDPVNQPCIEMFNDMQSATGQSVPQICTAAQEVLDCVTTSVAEKCGVPGLTLVHNFQYGACLRLHGDNYLSFTRQAMMMYFGPYQCQLMPNVGAAGVGNSAGVEAVGGPGCTAQGLSTIQACFNDMEPYMDREYPTAITSSKANFETICSKLSALNTCIQEVTTCNVGFAKSGLAGLTDACITKRADWDGKDPECIRVVDRSDEMKLCIAKSISGAAPDPSNPRAACPVFGGQITCTMQYVYPTCGLNAALMVLSYARAAASGYTPDMCSLPSAADFTKAVGATPAPEPKHDSHDGHDHSGHGHAEPEPKAEPENRPAQAAPSTKTGAERTLTDKKNGASSLAATLLLPILLLRL